MFCIDRPTTNQSSWNKNGNTHDSNNRCNNCSNSCNNSGIRL